MTKHAFAVDISTIVLSDADTPTRIPLAMIGTFHKGAQKFTITRKDVATMAANFAKRGNGEIVLDYEHASEMPEVAAGGPIPAAGWIVAVEAAPDDKGIVWGEVKLTAKARALIASKEYKYISPVIYWGARDRATGGPQGITLRSAALTNTPVLDGMPAITLSDTNRDAGWAAVTERGDMSTQTAVMCSEHPDTQMLCPKCNYVSTLEASEVTKVLRLSGVTRDDAGLITMDAAVLADHGFISTDVFRAYDSQRIALSEVEKHVISGKISPAARAKFTRLALSDYENFRSIVSSMKPMVDLTERGHGGTGNADDTDHVERQVLQLSEARAKADGIALHDSMKLVAAENPELFGRWKSLLRDSITAQS